jgi:hypothetical protein
MTLVKYSRRILPAALVFASNVRAMSSMAPKVHVDHSSQMITISPAEAPVRASMVLLHGLGDTAQGWAGAAHEMVQKVDGLRVVRLSFGLPSVCFSLTRRAFTTISFVGPSHCPIAASNDEYGI